MAVVVVNSGGSVGNNNDIAWFTQDGINFTINNSGNVSNAFGTVPYVGSKLPYFAIYIALDFNTTSVSGNIVSASLNISGGPNPNAGSPPPPGGYYIVKGNSTSSVSLNPSNFFYGKQIVSDYTSTTNNLSLGGTNFSDLGPGIKSTISSGSHTFLYLIPYSLTVSTVWNTSATGFDGGGEEVFINTGGSSPGPTLTIITATSSTPALTVAPH